MAHKVILPPKKNYIPQFLKQRDINSYYLRNACFSEAKNLRNVRGEIQQLSRPKMRQHFCRIKSLIFYFVVWTSFSSLHNICIIHCQCKRFQASRASAAANPYLSSVANPLCIWFNRFLPSEATVPFTLHSNVHKAIGNTLGSWQYVPHFYVLQQNTRGGRSAYEFR